MRPHPHISQYLVATAGDSDFSNIKLNLIAYLGWNNYRLISVSYFLSSVRSIHTDNII